MEETYYPAITIVTPSFNQAQYLEAAICSVLEQDYPDLEYLVIDGGSTDGSVEIIERYNDRIDWWISEPDHGQSEAINKGFHRAQGDIIGWLNSDDVLLPGTLKMVAEAFETHPDAVLVYGDVHSIDAAGKIFNTMRYGQWELEDLMRFSILGQPAVFIRRKLLRALGYLEESFHFLMDHHLWLRMAQEGDMLHLPAVLACARYHQEAKNIARAVQFGPEAFRMVGWMRTQPLLQRLLLDTKLEKQVEAGAYRFHARYLVDGGEYRAAFRAYRKAFFRSPTVALTEWHRWLFSGLGCVGFAWLARVFYRAKHAFTSRTG
ncbi:MAG: glycosyltransferase [Anaerolineae bacterium]|nr:glycosyltransferase [Anaerolineae bacterium]